MTDPTNPRPKGTTEVQEPEADKTGFDSKTSASIKLGAETDTEKDLKAAILTPEVQQPPDQSGKDGSEHPNAEWQSPERNSELAQLFQGADSQADLKARLQSIGTPDFEALGVKVKPLADGTLGASVAFDFPHATQIRGEFGVKTDFSKSPEHAPSYKGEKVKSITVGAASTQNPYGTVSIETDKGVSTVLNPAERRQFEFPQVFNFSDGTGNRSTIFANGDKQIVQSDGRKITQFGPFEPTGRQFKSESTTGDGKSSVTFFQDGQRQIDLDPPRADGIASVVEQPQTDGNRYDAKILTPPNQVPEQLAETLILLTDSGKTGDRKQELDAVKKLAELELQSPEAKAALERFAASSPEHQGVVRYARLNQEGGPRAVLLGAGILPSAERLEVVRAAAFELTNMSQTADLSSEQLTLATRGMAFAIYDGRAENSNGTLPVSRQLRAVLETSMLGPNREAAMKAAVDMVKLGDKRTVNQLGLADEFIPVVLRGASEAARDGKSWNSVAKHLDEIKQISKTGNRAALAIMTAIADGGDTYKPRIDGDSVTPEITPALQSVQTFSVGDLAAAASLADSPVVESVSANGEVESPEVRLQKKDVASAFSGTVDADDEGETENDGDRAEFFVSAEISNNDAPPTKEKIDTPEKAAKAVFGEIDNLVSGAAVIPESGKDYRSLTFHEKVAGMVAEFLNGEKPDQAFADLRIEAGRPEWTGASSIAPSAFHKLSVVKAVLDLEKAIDAGDKDKQKDAMRELAKLRSIKPGSDFQAIHKAIDDYLKIKTEQQPGLIGRDQFNEYRRQSEERLKESFKQSSHAFAGFLTAPDDQKRQQALDAFQKSVNDNPDARLLEWSAKLGDFGSALNLKQQLLAEKPDAKAIQEALERLDKTSPALSERFLSDVLMGLKTDPKTAEQFSKVNKLEVKDLAKLLKDGQLDSVLPQLRKSMQAEPLQELFKELDDLKKSKHSPLDLLKAGVSETPKELDEAVQRNNDDIRREEHDLRRLEHEFLKRNGTQEERDRVIRELQEKSEQSRLTIGARSGPDTYRLEQLNNVLGLKTTDDPQLASEYLKALKESSAAGNPHAKAMLDRLLPGQEPQKIDDLIKKMAAGGDAGRDALKQLKPETKFVDAELDSLRIENLTWNHRGDKPPSTADLNALRTALKVESDSGNKGADTWLAWCDAAKLVIPLQVGSGATKEARIENIKQLGELAQNGNDHARKALLAILVDPVNPQTRAYWNAEFNSDDGPKGLNPDLPKSVKQDSYEYTDAAVKALVTAYDGKTDRMGRADALALSLALGHWSDRFVMTSTLDAVLRKGMEGKNGDAVLAGVHDALNINAPGGEQLARTILHGANLPEFQKFVPSFVRWAEAGDKVGMQVAAGLLAGRTDNAGLIEAARDTFLKIGADKRYQKPALEALMQAYDLDVKQSDGLKKTLKGNPLFLETLGDVFGKTDRKDIPDKLFAETKELFRKEMEFFDRDSQERTNPEQKNRYEHVVRGFVALSSHFDKTDIGLLRATPQLAKALGEKEWQLPKELEGDFKTKMFTQVALNPVDTLACLANAGKILTPDNVSTIMRTLPRDMPESTEMASMKFLLSLIGDKNASQAVKDQALKEIETHEWKSPKLDTELRKCLSDYVHGRVGDLKQLDRVIALVGNIGIEPPMALVLSRLGLPLDEQTIWEVEEGLRNFNGDRAAYSKVIENAVILNALPKELNLFGNVDLKELVQRMADGPLTDNSEFAMLLGDKVPKLLSTLEDLQYGLLEKEAAASGNPMNRFQLQDAIFEPWKRGSTISGGFHDGQVKQSVENLQNITRDGHQTSYWWLAAGGVGYLARRFGPGGTEDKFAAKQKDALDAWKSAKEASVKSTLQTTALLNGIVQIDTAKRVGEYVQLLSKGSIIASDELALTIAGKMGSQGLQTGAPFIYDALRGTKIDDRTGLPSQPGEIWERLRRNHATDLKAAPIFGTEFTGASDALRFLQRSDLKQPDLKTSDRYHFMSKKAHDFALGEAFKAVDSGPEYTRAMESYGKLMGVNNSMETLFHMGMSGYKGEAFVKLARELSKDMDRALAELKRREPDIKYLIETFKDASKNATDPEAKKGLDARVKNLEDMLKMIPGTNGGKNDERYDITKEMCRLIDSADFNSESFLKWFKDNGPVLIWTTIAVAGILAMPFSGGASGVLTAIAVSALIATVSYGAVEAYKELVYQGGGSAQGSDFWRAALEVVTGDKYVQQNLRYDPKTGKFKAPPTQQEIFETALKQIGKDTALNLIGAGFGKLLTVAAKALPAARLAATELTADAKVIVEGLNKVASKNVAASTYGTRFAKIFFESLPLGVVGATTGAIIQDELKAIKDNRELVEFAGHAVNICLTVLFHRVGGHLMQPRMTRTGAMEIPYDKNAFLEAMKQEYGKAGKPMPEYKIDGETVKVSVGGKVMELRFVDPAKVAAELDAKGVKPAPLLPGEHKPGDQKPADQKPADQTPPDQKPPVEQKPGSTDKPPVVPEGGDPALPKQSQSPAAPAPKPAPEVIKPALETIAKEATGANGKLSPTNRDAGKDAAANRKYLEDAVKDGNVTPEQVNKLMTLETADLSAVLKMMREGTVTPKAMDRVMQWESNQRELFLTTSPKQMKTVSQAIERGLLDGPTMEKLSDVISKSGMERTNTMDILAGLAAEPNSSAATVKRLLELTGEERAHIRKVMIEGEEVSFNNTRKLSAKQLTAALSTDFSGAKLNKLVTAMQMDGISADTLKTLIECKSVDKVLNMDVDQRRQVTSAISGYKLNPQSADVLIKRVLGEPTGNAAVDALLKPDVIAKMLDGTTLGSNAHLNNLLSLASEHVSGTATRPIEVMKKLLALEPSSSDSAMSLIKNNKLSTSDLNKVLDELASISDANVQSERARSHAELSVKNFEFHQRLLAVEPASLRGGLVSSASRGHLSLEQLPKVLEARASSPEGAKFVDRVLAEKSNINKIELIENMQSKAVTPVELKQMTESMESGKLSLDNVRSLIQLTPKVRAQALEILKTKPVGNVDELLSLAADKDGSAFLSAIGRDHLQLSDATRMSQLAHSGERAEALHGEHLRAVLRAENETPTKSAANIKEMLEQPKLASDAAMRVPEQFHTHPTTRLQAQAFKKVDALKNGETKDALTAFVRDKLPAMHMGERSMLDASGLNTFEPADFGRLKAHFDLLVDGLSGKGALGKLTPKELEALAIRFPDSSILISAYEAGIRIPLTGKNAIPAGDFEVFLHGTDAASATKVIESNGGTISATHVSKKGVPGEYYTTESIRVGRAYSKESNRGDKPGAVVAIAIPKEVAAELRAKGWLKDGDFVKIENGTIDLVRGGNMDNIAGTEKVFTKEALAVLREKGFFFELDIKPKPAPKGVEAPPGGPAAPGGPGGRPGTTTGAKPAPGVEKPGTTDAVVRPTPEGTTPAKLDMKAHHAKLETARQEYLKNPSDPVAKAHLTDLLQQSVNEQFRIHGIPVEYAPKVSVEPMKPGERPTSDFSNETYKIRVGEDRLQTPDGVMHDPRHEGFHAILCLDRTAAYLHSRPQYMARLTDAWAADLKAGHNIAGENPINRPVDQAARNATADILQPVLKPYSKGVVTEAEARASLDRGLGTTDGAAQLKVLADKMGVTPEQAKAYLHSELNNFFRLEKWHILPEAYLNANPKLKAYLESIGQQKSNQLGRLIDPLVKTHRGLFDPEVYRFGSPEEHRARIHQYSEELKHLLETRGKGAKTSEDAQNLVDSIKDQSRLWQFHEQMRKLEGAKSAADAKTHLEQMQKLAEQLKKDLAPDDPLHAYLSMFDKNAPAKPRDGKAPPATPKPDGDGKAPTKKSNLEKPVSSEGSPVKPGTEKIPPDAKPVQDLWTALIADAPKTNHGELLSKVREGKFTPEEVDGLTKVARRDGPDLVNRILKLPAEARSAALNELIRTGASAENLRVPLQAAEVHHGISKMDSSYHKAMTELASTPEGLDLARRVLALPEDIVRENIKPENLTSNEVLAILNNAEIAHVERLEVQARGGKPPLKESDVLKPDELARYKAIKEQQDALGKVPLRMEDAEISKRVDGYLKGEGHAKESLPPDGVVKKGKTLHIVLGAPGAGKSKSIVEGLQKDHGARLIDSDLIKPDLPGYKGGLGTQLVHPVSDKIATAVRNRAYSEGENIVQPVIGRTYEGIHAIIRQARANGYDVAIHLADIPPETSVRRVYDRGYAKDPVEGGVQQVIPLSYPLEAVGHRPNIVFDYLVKTPGLIDAYTKYNTNTFPAKLVDKSPRQLPTFKPGSPGAPPPGSAPPPPPPSPK